MGDVVSFGRRPRNKPKWRFISIAASEDVEGVFDVRAWTGDPSNASTRMMYFGPCASFAEAADLADAKSRLIGVDEIVDWSGYRGPGPDGAA